MVQCCPEHQPFFSVSVDGSLFRPWVRFLLLITLSIIDNLKMCWTHEDVDTLLENLANDLRWQKIPQNVQQEKLTRCYAELCEDLISEHQESIAKAKKK